MLDSDSSRSENVYEGHELHAEYLPFSKYRWGLLVLFIFWAFAVTGIIELHYHVVQVFNWCVRVYSDLLGLAAS